jgi:excisionase family DNA binding protein
MTDISPRTAQLAFVALGAAVRMAAPRRNGAALPDDVIAALLELGRAAAGTELGQVAPPPRHSEQLDVATAATRLGISARAVRKRITTGHLPARKVGATWLVELEEQVHV